MARHHTLLCLNNLTRANFHSATQASGSELLTVVAPGRFARMTFVHKGLGSPHYAIDDEI